MNLLDELEGEGWSIQQALLTTYPFDPQFFSGYVRPRLGKRNCDLPMVLMDSDRYEREITSGEWREAPMGTDYLLEPVYSDGVFHPKVNLYASERSVYFTVSSANLGLEEYCKAAQIGNSGGFQKYWLTDDDHTVGEEYHIAREVRSFFEAIHQAEDYVTGQDANDYLRQTVTTLDWLDETEADGVSSERTTWFLSNLNEPILDQVVERVGKVETVQMYAPFYGTPNVLQQIADTLSADRIEFIVESESTAMDVESLPENLDVDFVVREMEHSTTRWVHAKFMTLKGEWGSACLYGSPNMTSTALLNPSTRSNVEAGMLQIFEGSQNKPLNDSLFHNASFPFELSEPIDDLSALSLRDRSYEGWEDTVGNERTALRLRDAQLTQPGSDDESELIVRLGGVTGDHSIVIETEDGVEHRQAATLEEETELSILLDDAERENWRSAAVKVRIPSEGLQSNTRQVVQETQEYYREFRDITQSDGTQSSTTLLRTVFQNPETNAAGVFNIAISELQKRSELSAGETTPQAREEEDAPQFPERSPARLAGASSSAPSLPTLINKQLTYQRDRALEFLESDERPTQDSMEQFVDHLSTFWETIELCLVMDCIGELDSSKFDQQKLFNTCNDQVTDLLDEFPGVVQGLNGIIDRIESEEETREAFLSGETDSVAEDEIWADVFDCLFYHPGLVLELDYQAERQVTDPRNQFANRMKSVFDIANPAIWQHLYMGSRMRRQAKASLENLQVDYADVEQDLQATTRGVQVLSLYLFVQELVSNPDFVNDLQSHPMFSSEDIRKIAEFAVEADEAIVEYGLVGDVQWTFTLKSSFEVIQELQ